MEQSLAGYDAFYAVIERVLRQRERRSGRFVVLDVHSYNHRRRGVSRSPMDEPEVNVGTGTLDRGRWGALVDRFIGDLSGSVAGGLDVRENVRFSGGELSAWIHRTFSETGCALALVDISVPVIEALERKVKYRKYGGATLENRALATL